MYKRQTYPSRSLDGTIHRLPKFQDSLLVLVQSIYQLAQPLLNTTMMLNDLFSLVEDFIPFIAHGSMA